MMDTFESHQCLFKTRFLQHAQRTLGAFLDTTDSADAFMKLKCNFYEDMLVEYAIANESLVVQYNDLLTGDDLPVSSYPKRHCSTQTTSSTSTHPLDTAILSCGLPAPATISAATQTVKKRTKHRLCQSDLIISSADFSSQVLIPVPVANCASQCDPAPAPTLIDAQPMPIHESSECSQLHSEVRLPPKKKDQKKKQENSVKRSSFSKIGRSTIIQCFKCQGFGHKSFSCKNSPKCVKCGLAHFSHECLKPKEQSPSCANCSKGHTANYAKCSVFQDYISSLKNRLPFKHSFPANSKDRSSRSVMPPPSAPTGVKVYSAIHELLQQLTLNNAAVLTTLKDLLVQ